VLTGFDDYESLNQEKPDAIINSVQNLSAVIATSSSAGSEK